MRLVMIFSLLLGAACDAKDPMNVTTVQSSCTIDTVGGYQPENHYQFFTDMEPGQSNWSCPEEVWTAEPGRPAICRFPRGGTDTSGFVPGSNRFVLTGGPIDMRVSYRLADFADETDDYLVRIGFCNQPAGYSCTNGVWLEHTSADHYWHCRSADNSSYSSDTADEEVVVGDWAAIWLHIDTEVPAFTAGYAGDALFCSVTTNIPTTNASDPQISTQYISGVESQHYLDIDYVVIDQDLTDPR